MFGAEFAKGEDAAETKGVAFAFGENMRRAACCVSEGAGGEAAGGGGFRGVRGESCGCLVSAVGIWRPANFESKSPYPCPFESPCRRQALQRVQLISEHAMTSRRNCESPSPAPVCHPFHPIHLASALQPSRPSYRFKSPFHLWVDPPVSPVSGVSGPPPSPLASILPASRISAVALLSATASMRQKPLYTVGFGFASITANSVGYVCNIMYGEIWP